MKLSSILSIALLAIAAEAKFGNEASSTFQDVLAKIRAGCEGVGGACSSLAGDVISGILAAAPECAQQDLADKIVDTAKTAPADKKAQLIEAAKLYRTHEKNTEPNFNVRVNGAAEDRKSFFCQKAPKNAELNGLVQDQSPAAANVFFDPKNSQQDVAPGSDPRTVPFGGAGAAKESGKKSPKKGKKAKKAKKVKAQPKRRLYSFK